MTAAGHVRAKLAVSRANGIGAAGIIPETRPHKHRAGDSTALLDAYGDEEDTGLVGICTAGDDDACS